MADADAFGLEFDNQCSHCPSPPLNKTLSEGNISVFSLCQRGFFPPVSELAALTKPSPKLHHAGTQPWPLSASTSAYP